MDTSMWRTWGLIVVLLVGLLPAAATGAECPIVEGTGIGAVTIGMGTTAALAITGPAVRQQASGNQITYTLGAPWSQMITEYGFVRRVATRVAQCRTARGVGPGSTAAMVRDAYAAAQVSSLTPVQDGALLSYPFVGVAFLLRGDRVDAVEVFQAEGTRAARPAAPVAQVTAGGLAPRGAGPSPAATTAPGTWSIRSTSIKVERGDLVTSGVVENRSAARSAYAEVRAFSGTGQQVGQGNAPLHPGPVPNGGSATFEVHFPINGIPRRYTVTIHPANQSNEVLAQATVEVKDLSQFASIVVQLLQVSTQSTAGRPNPTSIVIQVTNGSSLPVASVSVDVELTVTCQTPFSEAPQIPESTLVALFAAATPRPPIPPGTPRPPMPPATPLPPIPPATPRPTIAPPTPQSTPRTIQETWRGSATVQGIPPGGTGRAPVQLSGGNCAVFTSWTAATRIGNIKVGE